MKSSSHDGFSSTHASFSLSVSFCFLSVFFSQCLDYAFRHCTRSAVGNKRRILQFLIPVKLLKARYPHERLLTKYELTEFQDLIQSIQRGDLEKFNQNLELHQRFYIQKGIYLILEKLKIFVYRNLFRKV